MSFVTDTSYGSLASNNDAVGTVGWTDPENVLINDPDANFGFDKYATFGYVGQAGETLRAHNAKLVVNGDIVGNNLAPDTAYNDYNVTEHTIGGTSNLWGLTSIDPRVARRRDFGFALSMCTHSSGGTLQTQSYYIVVTGFKFQLPKNATILGVEFILASERSNVGGGTDRIELNYVKARLTYDYTFVLTGQGKSSGFLRFDEYEEPETPQDKHYQYMAYENNNFAGQWKDVTTDPTLQINMNQLPGELPVTLARNLDSHETTYDEIAISGHAGEVLSLTQSGETILGGQDTSYGVGSGTDLEVDHTVVVKEYYGGFVGLLTSQGQPLLTSQLDELQVAEGHPRGRNYYQGYVSDYGLIYDVDNLATSVKLLHLSDEMNNEVYRTPDTLKSDYLAYSPQMGQGFGGWFKFYGDVETVDFTFTAIATYDLKRIVLAISGWRNNIITITLRSGGTINAGTVLGTATAQITKDGVNLLSFAFADPVALTNAAQYNVHIESGYIKQTGSQSFPAIIYMGPTYAGGASYADGVLLANDFAFQTWQNGGNTSVNELSIDPSQIMRKVLDYGKNVGNIMDYDGASIESSFTVVSAPFNTNTLKEAADYVLKLTPADWYYFIDPGTTLFNLHSRPENVTQWFEKGKDIIKLELHKNIEKIINDVLFTGGGNPALFREYIDSVSRTQWRKGLAKLSDNRVTDPTTADILMQAAADQVSQPIWIGTVEILRAEHPKFVLPGELAGFRAFGNLIDLLNVQIVGVNVTPDKFICQLGTQSPKTGQRIEDIKRNLNLLEVENNPSSPS